MKKNLAIFGTIALIIILVFSISIFIVHQAAVLQVSVQQEESQSILPYTVDTYGNAWDGVLAFGVNSYLVVMETNGTLLDLRTSASGGYGVVKNIDQNTLLFQGEPQVNGASSAPNYETHIWNVISNTTQDFPNIIGEHDVEYNPVNNTFLTLQDYVRQVGNNSILYDKIVQLDPTGNVLWSWDTYNYIPLSEADPFNLTSTFNGQTVIDFTHANALYWDYNNSAIYLNLRNTNTFYKINQTTGNIIWACGQFGNFTLLDQNGNVVPNLWYHGHDLEEVAPDVFTMFNNDFDNITNPNDANSQMIEFTLNEQNMTAQLNWSWTAPQQYYTQYLGATDILPNGDWIGDFGSPTHQFPQNQPWNFTNTGAVLIEVNPAGEIVRTITFPTGWSIYRIDIATNFSQTTSIPNPTLSPIPSSTSPPSIETNSPTSAPPTASPTTPPTLTPSASPKQTLSSIPPIASVRSTKFITITDLAFVIIPILIVTLAAFVYLRKKKNGEKHDVKNGD
jgi:hypothetical protein